VSQSCLRSSRKFLVAIFAFALAPWAMSPASAGTAACPNVNHSGQNFAGQDLKGRNFSNQNLTNANFAGAQLQGATFTGATLTGVDFSSAQLGAVATGQPSTSFSRAILTNACFTGALVNAADFQFANLACTVFDLTDLSQAVFGPIILHSGPAAGCRTSFVSATMNCEFIPQWKNLLMTRALVQACYERLQNVDFTDARMEGVVFSGINLNGTRWTNAQLAGAYFLNSKLKNAVLSGADLRRAQLSQADATGAKIDNQARLSGAHLSGATLKGADLTGAILQAADGYPSADLSLVFMPDAILTDTKLTGVNMSHANFYGALAKADNATMQQIDMSNANLGGLNLSQGRLRGAKLDAVDLVDANLTGADLTPTADQISSSLVQSNLQGANFTGAKLGGANLSNAAVAFAQGVMLFKAPASLAGDLDRRELSAEVIGAFTSSGQHLIECNDPAVFLDVAGTKWQIWLSSSVGPNGARFQKFSLTLSSGKIKVAGLSSTAAPVQLFDADKVFVDTLDKKLMASALLAQFRSQSYPLPGCINPMISVKTAGSLWNISETLSMITVAGIGYTGFNLAVEEGAIQAYGSEVTIIRRDEGGSLTLVPVPIRATTIAAENLDNLTTCPNQRSYGANVASGATWKQMMTAVAPPPPPACIPSLYTFCN